MEEEVGRLNEQLKAARKEIKRYLRRLEREW